MVWEAQISSIESGVLQKIIEFDEPGYKVIDEVQNSSSGELFGILIGDSGKLQLYRGHSPEIDVDPEDLPPQNMIEEIRQDIELKIAGIVFAGIHDASMTLVYIPKAESTSFRPDFIS